MDSDDSLDSTALEILSRKMDQQNLEVVIFNAEAFGDDPECAGIAYEKNHSYFMRELYDEIVFSGP